MRAARRSGLRALTATLALSPERATWSDFRWENGYEDAEAAEEFRRAFSFDRAGYELLLEQALAVVSELPYDVAEHQRRGFCGLGSGAGDCPTGTSSGTYRCWRRSSQARRDCCRAG